MLLIVVNSITFSHRAKYIWAAKLINVIIITSDDLCLILNLTFVRSSETCTCDSYNPETGQLFFHSTALCQNCDVRRLHTICSAWMRYSLFAAVATKSCVILNFISDLCTVTLTITKAGLWLWLVNAQSASLLVGIQFGAYIVTFICFFLLWPFLFFSFSPFSQLLLYILCDLVLSISLWTFSLSSLHSLQTSFSVSSHLPISIFWALYLPTLQCTFASTQWAPAVLLSVRPPCHIQPSP